MKCMRIDVSLVAKSSPTLVTPWTVACQAPRSMEFPRQEYWRRLPLPSPGDLPNPEIGPMSPALQVNSLVTEPQEKPTGLSKKQMKLGK